MKNQRSTYSVNVCTNCRKNLTLTADQLGYRECPECTYLANIGARNITDYNEYLRKNQSSM